MVGKGNLKDINEALYLSLVFVFVFSTIMFADVADLPPEVDYMILPPTEQTEVSSMITIIVNGVPVDSTPSPYILSGRTYVSDRTILEAYGVDSITWEAPNIFMSCGDVHLKIPIERNIIEKNGVVMAIDSGAMIKDGYMAIPIRAVIEALGGIVSWDDLRRTVRITKPADLSKSILLDFEALQVGSFTQLTQNGFEVNWIGYGDVTAVSSVNDNQVLKDSDINNVYGAEVCIRSSGGESFYFHSLEFNNYFGRSTPYYVYGQGSRVVIKAYTSAGDWFELELFPNISAFTSITGADIGVDNIYIDELRINLVSLDADYSIDNIRLTPSNASR
jgi:hypothetical protein